MKAGSDTTPGIDSHISSALLLGIAAFLVLVWGSAFTLVDVIVRTVSPDWLVSYRLIIGALLVVIFVKWRGLSFPPLMDVRWLWYGVLGVTGMSLPFVLVATGQASIDSGLTAIIIGSMPLITVVLAHFFTEEKLTIWKSLGFLLGFIGIVILFLPKELSFALVSDWAAQLLVLGGAISYAVTTVAAARAPETPSAVAAAMMLIWASVLSPLWAFSTAGPPPMPNAVALSCLIALGVGSTAIATIVYLFAIDRAGPSFIAKINYFVPVTSVVLGVLILREALDWRIFASLGMIVIGLMIARIKTKVRPIP